MPNTRISDLTAATSVAGTDVYPSVQTAGVGPVKTSLTQITAFALANAPAGAVATPSIAPTGDTNTGFWFPAADTIAASTGGSERLRINSSGNVGIGTTSPASRLDVSASNYVDPVLTISQSPITTGNKGVINFTDSAGTTGAIYSYGSAFGAGNNYALTFLTNTGSSLTEKMRIDSAGNLGVGTQSPASFGKIVAGGFGYTASIQTGFAMSQSTDLGVIAVNSIYTADNAGFPTTYFNAQNTLILRTTSAYPIIFRPNNSTAMTITSAGLVGINMTPVERLDIDNGSVRATRAATGFLELPFMSRYSSSFSPVGLGQGGTGIGYLVNVHNEALAFGTNNTEKMRINSAGRVGIGTQDPSAALEINTAAIHLILQYGSLTTRRSVITSNAGFSAVYNGLIIGSNASDKSVQVSSAVSSWYQELGSYDISGDAWKVLYQAPGAGSASEFMRITNAGNVLIGTTSSPTTGTRCLTVGTGTAPTATPADTVTFYSSDLSAGNTIPSIYTEGTGIVSSNTGTTNLSNRIAVRINGTVYYLLAASSA